MLLIQNLLVVYLLLGELNLILLLLLLHTPLYDVEFINDKVYTKSLDSLDKYLRKNMKEIYKERVDFYYKQFVENIPYPIIKFNII